MKTKLEITTFNSGDKDGQKWNTNIDNVYVYKVRAFGHASGILAEQRNKYSGIYGEKSIIIEFSSFNGGVLCGDESVYFSRGTKKYDIGYKEHIIYPSPFLHPHYYKILPYYDLKFKDIN